MDSKHIGIDFDNTIVLYDELFYELALKEGLIRKGSEKTKHAVRAALIKENKEHIFIEIQGIVYGKLIKDAPAQPGIQKVLHQLINNGYKISIFSHKTKFPIIGEKLDLHVAARNWLEINGFNDPKIVGIEKKNIYFNETQEKKVSKIEKTGCAFFIDDLIKVLNDLDNRIKKIHFSPACKNRELNSSIITMQSWNELIKIVFDN